MNTRHRLISSLLVVALLFAVLGLSQGVALARAQDAAKCTPLTKAEETELTVLLGQTADSLSAVQRDRLRQLTAQQECAARSVLSQAQIGISTLPGPAPAGVNDVSLTESFDGTTFPPAGWTSPTGSCTWSRVTAGTYPTQSPHSGAGEAKFNSFDCASGNTRQLVLPGQNFSVAGTYDIMFWMYHDTGYSTYNDRIQIQVATTLAGTYTNVGTAISRYSTSTGWVSHTVDLSAYAGQPSIYVSLTGLSEYGNNMYVDDVTFNSPPAAPNCAISPSPANAATNVALATNLSWASGGGAPTGYRLFFGTDNPPTNIANDVDLGLVTTYDPASDLAISTTHYWQIVPYNAVGAATGCSVWSFTAAGPPLNGTYTVGTGGDYPSLTNAGGIFEAINGSGASGNVTINVIADLTGETGTNALNEIAGGYTVLIKPSGAARTITGTGTGANLIKLNGADGVTIDGSLSGGTDRSLAIVNPYANSSASVIWLASTAAGNGATNNTIKNCTAAGASSTTTLGDIVSSGSTLGTVAEAANANNTYQNNAVTTAQYGIALVGPSGNETGNSIIDNLIGSTVAASKIGLNGIAVFQQANATVARNSIAGVNTATTSTASGIRVSGTASSIFINANKIADVKNTNTGGYGANGIQLNSSVLDANVTIANNFISDVAGYGYALTGVADNGYGIIAVSGAGYKIYHNSVRMTTNQTLTTGIPAAINITSGITQTGGIDLRDNIFANTQTIGTRYAIYSGAVNTVFSNIDYNDYYPGTGTLGYLGSAQATLAAWQTATGQDTHSLSADPQFVSTTDLHINGLAASPVADVGTPLAAVTTDFDNQARSATTPDIGADEFMVGTCPLSGSYPNDVWVTGPCTVSGDATMNGNLTVSGDLSVNPGVTLTLGTNALSVSGSLTNNGAISQQKSVTGSSDVSFLNTGGYGGVTINANSVDLGVTTVRISGNQACDTTDSLIHRCFNITPANTTGRNAAITFFYNSAELNGDSCSTLNAYHWNGSSWDLLTLDGTYGTGGRSCTADPYSVRVTGVTSFSPFGLRSNAPTAVTLSGLAARSTDASPLLPLGILLMSVTAVALIVQRKRH